MPAASPFTFGGAYPLAQPGSGSLLADADPALFWALQFWATVLRANLDVRATAEGAAASAPFASGAVRTVLGIDPGPFPTESLDFAPPALAAWRIEGAVSMHTMTWEKASDTWGLAYYLPPLSLGSAKRMVPLLHAVSRILIHATTAGRDPSFAGGARVWGPGYANLMSIRIVSHTFPDFVEDESTGLRQYRYVGRAEVVERVMPSAGGVNPLASAAVAVGQPADGAPGATPDDVDATLIPIP